MALLIQHGADINSVEAAEHLDQSSPYRWIRHLRNWDSHAAGNDSQLRSGTVFNPLIRRWIDKRRKFRFAPLALAARRGLTTAAKWLLEHGADPEVPARDLCSCQNDPLSTFEMWPALNYVRPVMDQPHWTALHLAIHYGHEDIVQLLVDHGADTRQVCRSQDGPCSALHTAFIHSRVSMIEFLMHRFRGTNMVDINARGRGGITPVHIAFCVQPTLLDLALKLGAYVNFEYEFKGNQWTLFSMACAQEDKKLALRLLKLGASPDFNIERESGGRWRTYDFRKSLEWCYGPDASALALEIDQIDHDHEVAWLEL